MSDSLKAVKATILADTYLKRRIGPAADLAKGDRLLVKTSTEFQVLDSAQEKQQHRWLKLAEPITAEDGTSQLTEVYCYDPHVDVEGEKLTLRLPVVYHSQMDNNPKWQGAPNRQCNVTSTVMMLDYILKGRLTQLATDAGFREAEGYYGKILKEKFGADTTDHDGHTRCLHEEFGVESYWSKTLSARDLRRQLELNIPVVIGVAFKVSGHILCLVGIDEVKGNYLVHDPFGIRHGGSNNYDVGARGAFDVYSLALMDQLFWDVGAEAGWGRIITKIGEKRYEYAVGAVEVGCCRGWLFIGVIGVLAQPAPQSIMTSLGVPPNHHKIQNKVTNSPRYPPRNSPCLSPLLLATPCLSNSPIASAPSKPMSSPTWTAPKP